MAKCLTWEESVKWTIYGLANNLLIGKVNFWILVLHRTNQNSKVDIKVVVWSFFLKNSFFSQKNFFGLKTTSYLWSLTCKLLGTQISLLFAFFSTLTSIVQKNFHSNETFKKCPSLLWSYLHFYYGKMNAVFVHNLFMNHRFQ